MKQPNQRVCFQFGGFKNLVFEFHKARIKRTRGSESWFLSQWTVNRCVCVCIYVCTLGVHRLPKVVCKDMCGFNQWASGFWTPCRLLSRWSVCRHSYHLEGFMFTFHTSLFHISLLIHPYSCCDGKTSEGQTKTPCGILILRKQSALMTDKNFLSTQTVSNSLF